MTASLQAIRERDAEWDIQTGKLNSLRIVARRELVTPREWAVPDRRDLLAKLELAMAWMNHKSNCALAHRGLVIDVDCCTCGLDAALKEIEGHD